MTDMTDDTDHTKTCFVVTPIGHESSPTRRAADGLVQAVIQPTLVDLGFATTVAHTIDAAGSITRQVIELVLQADLVVANLTELNPNVMYEVAVRHCSGLPIVLLAEHGTPLPFDLAAERTVFYRNDLHGAVELGPNLNKAVKAAMASPEADNPVYRAVQRKVIKDMNPSSDADAYILERLDNIETAIAAALGSRFQQPTSGTFFNYSFDAIGPRDAIQAFAAELSKEPNVTGVTSEIFRKVKKNDGTDTLANRITFRSGIRYSSISVIDLADRFNLMIARWNGSET